MLALLHDVKRWAGSRYLISLRPSFVFIALLGFSLVGAATIGTPPPVWKIGRAAFEWRAAPPSAGQNASAQAVPVVKLSLRNEGGAGNLPVQIFGRWTVQSAPPQAFVLLGSYQQQVALTQTAIVEASLIGLSKAPAAKLLLEIAVMTGAQETDRKSMAWN